MPSNNSKYSEEFRERTCRHILETGKSATSVGEENGVDKNTICRWVRDYRRKNMLPSYEETKKSQNTEKRERSKISAQQKADYGARRRGRNTKKSPAHLYASTEIKYGFLEAHRSEHKVKKMCKVLRISESGYYRWRNKPVSKKAQEDAELLELIKEIHEENLHTAGAEKIRRALSEKGKSCSVGRIYRIMRENGIYTVYSFKHRPYPKMKEESRYSENVLDRKFAVSKPNQVWTGDITYIKTKAGWVYLAVVIDLFNKEVIGYWLSKKPNTELARKALEQALFSRDYPKGVLFHSDRGCQYSSKRYLGFIEENEMKSSMSRKGNPYDNACTESFFATLKKEWIYFKRYANMEEVERSLFEYIELFYNRKRMHRSLSYMSPSKYLAKYHDQKAA